MIITNSPKNYTQEQLEQMTLIIHSMNDLMQKTIGIISSETKKLTINDDNVVYINTRISSEYKRLLFSAIELHEVITIYNGWHQEMFSTATKNIGQYHIISVQRHIEDMVKICKSFISLIKEMN